MARQFVFEIRDFTGGLNQASAEMIADNELAQLDDWYLEGPSLWTRKGYESLATGYTEDVLSVFMYDPDAAELGDDIVLIGGKSSVAKVSGTSIAALDVADGRVYPSSSNRWWFVQYGDEVYAAQKGNGGVKRIFGTSMMEAGIPAPLAAPSVEDGGDGKKEEGAYRWAYRYYNRETGARSNWSPLSREVAFEADRQAQLSEVTASSHPQVNARQIGCTKADGGVIFLVGQIDDNDTTTVYENASDAFGEYGEADVDADGNVITDVRHGTPPDQAWACELYKERLFTLNRFGLYWSEAGLMQSNAATSFLPVSRGTGLIHWHEHGLVITTEKNAQILMGDTPFDFRTDTGNLSAEHGCPAGKTLAIGDKVLFWYTGTNIVSTTGGAPQILPRIERVRTILDDVPKARKSEALATTLPSKGWYILAVPRSDDSWSLIVYSYKTDRFVGVWQNSPMTVQSIVRESGSEEKLYAAFEDDYAVYDYFTGADDDDEAIVSTLKTKNFGQGNHAVQKGTRRVNLLTPQTNVTFTLRIYHDGAQVEERTGLSLNKKGWKRFNVNTSGQPGHLVQVEIEYEGSTQLRLDAMQIEGFLLRGRRPIPA